MTVEDLALVPWYPSSGTDAVVVTVAAQHLAIGQLMHERPLIIAVVTVFTFATALYTILCNWLTHGGMSKLTRWRGEKWVKELDYLYILFGAVGLFWLLKAHPLTTHNITCLGLAPLLVVATALVLRLIKTRAEIGGWNKLPTTAAPPARK